MNIGSLAQLLLAYKYFVMIPAAVTLGPTASLLAGFFLRLGYIDLLPTCVALMGAELTADILWYWLGFRFGDRFVQKFGRYVGVSEHHIALVKKLFHQYHTSILFISKITMGLGLAFVVLFTAGLSRVPFRRYMLLNIGGQFVWTGVLLSVGFFLGNLYVQINGALEKIFAVSIGVVLLLCLFGFARFLRGRFIGRLEQ